MYVSERPACSPARSARQFKGRKHPKSSGRQGGSRGLCPGTGGRGERAPLALKPHCPTVGPAASAAPSRAAPRGDAEVGDAAGVGPERDRSSQSPPPAAPLPLGTTAQRAPGALTSEKGAMRHRYTISFSQWEQSRGEM